MRYFLEHIFIKKISRKKLAENLFRSGSGSGRFKKSDPYPGKNRPDPQHWQQHHATAHAQITADIFCHELQAHGLEIH
jgi:hypothetical protein